MKGIVVFFVSWCMGPWNEVSGSQSLIPLSVRAGVQSRSGQLWPEVVTQLQTLLQSPSPAMGESWGSGLKLSGACLGITKTCVHSISCSSSHLFSNLYEASVGH